MLLLTPAIASINARNPYHLDDNAKVLYGAGHFVAVGRRWLPSFCALTFFSVRIPSTPPTAHKETSQSTLLAPPNKNGG